MLTQKVETYIDSKEIDILVTTETGKSFSTFDVSLIEWGIIRISSWDTDFLYIDRENGTIETTEKSTIDPISFLISLLILQNWQENKNYWSDALMMLHHWFQDISNWDLQSTERAAAKFRRTNTVVTKSWKNIITKWYQSLWDIKENLRDKTAKSLIESLFAAKDRYIACSLIILKNSDRVWDEVHIDLSALCDTNAAFDLSIDDFQKKEESSLLYRIEWKQMICSQEDLSTVIITKLAWVISPSLWFENHDIRLTESDKVINIIDRECTQWLDKSDPRD